MKQTLHFISNKNLDPRRVQHHSDSVSNGLGREVGTELGTNHAAVPMGTGYLPPDHSCPVGLATRGCGVVFCFVHIGTPLAQVELCLLASIDTFNFQKGGVLPLVSEATFVASKNGLGPQPPAHGALLQPWSRQA